MARSSTILMRRMLRMQKTTETPSRRSSPKNPYSCPHQRSTTSVSHLLIDCRSGLRSQELPVMMSIHIEHGIPKPLTDRIMTGVRQFDRMLDFLPRPKRREANVTQQTESECPFQWMIRSGVIHPSTTKNLADVVRRFDSKCQPFALWKIPRAGAEA